MPFAYERYGYISVTAGSPEEAVQKAEEELKNMSLEEMHKASEYLTDSEEIDYDGQVLDNNGIAVEMEEQA